MRHAPNPADVTLTTPSGSTPKSTNNSSPEMTYRPAKSRNQMIQVQSSGALSLANFSILAQLLMKNKGTKK